MRGIYIIVEGQTEEEFVRESLAAYLREHGIYDVRAIMLETSPGHRGGDMRYARYKPAVQRLLASESDILVSSMIDLYRLETDFPGHEDSQKIENPAKRTTFLEKACAGDIQNERFIPYIQMFEFEGLVFADKRGFTTYFEDLTTSQTMEELVKIVDQYPNPELINDGPETAPSKRLIRLVPGYEKVLFGNVLILENEFGTLLEKCPRFSHWVKNLITTFKAGVS